VAAFEYSAAVLDHYERPRNVGEAPQANARAEVRSDGHGDRLTLSLRITRDGIVEEARFRAYGCVVAIAAGSMLTELLRGRTIADAARISNAEVAAALGGIPAAKVRCSVLAGEAIGKALGDFRAGGDRVGAASLP
jgi:NifU-like protein involved in Fe-S cluster formation